MPTSGLGEAYSPFGAADRLGKLCRDEHADGIEAEIVGIEQDIVGRTWLAETRALPPLRRGEQIANALAPVAAEYRVLDVVAIGGAERRAAFQQVVPHDRRGESRGSERGQCGLPALLERAAGSLLEGAPDLGDLDAALQLGMPGQEERRKHLRFLDHDATARLDDAGKLAQRPLSVHDVVEDVAAPEPVHALIRHGKGRAVAHAELHTVCGGLPGREGAGRGDPWGFGLQGGYPTGWPHHLGEPERVETDATAHVEAVRGRGKVELLDDAAGLRLLEAIHALQGQLRPVGRAHAPIVREGRVRHNRKVTRWRTLCCLALLAAALFPVLTVTPTVPAAETATAIEVQENLQIPLEQRRRLAHGEVVTFSVVEHSEREVAAGIALMLPAPTTQLAQYLSSGQLIAQDATIVDFGLVPPETPTPVVGPAFNANERDEARNLLDASPGTRFNLSTTEIDFLRSARGASGNSDRDAVDVASGAFRRLLWERVQSYRHSGLAAIAPYARAGGAFTDPAVELRLAIPDAERMGRSGAELHQALLRYPADQPSQVASQVYWVKRRVQHRPHLSLLHRMVVAD